MKRSMRGVVLAALVAAGLGWLIRARLGPPATDHVWVQVAAGVYPVGSADHPLNPSRSVELAAYEIADAETTNAQFARFVEATGYVTDAERAGYGMTFEVGLPDWAWESTEGATWRFPFGPDREPCRPDHPVTQVSQADAVAYCEWAGLRLPSQEEWEVAAAAGSTFDYPWGADLSLPESGWLANVWQGSHTVAAWDDGHLYTAPVRSYPPNAWGLHDVIGNVFEYTADPGKDRFYRSDPRLASARGGSWWCSAGTCHFFNLRDQGAQNRRASLANQGFRVAR